jgi:two-component sensor histidine kinase
MVMVATLIAGWRSGVMVAVAGGPLALWLTSGGLDRNQVGELAAWALMSSLVVLTGRFVRTVVISLRTRTDQLAQSERHQALLARELNHRVKNTLALVQAIARHTLKNATEPSAMKAYSDRLFALAAAHDLLLQSKWESAELREIATRVLSAHPADRWTLEGCDLPLRPRAAVYVSMGLHELTTNASKYGALSVPHGRVMLTWTIVHNSPARLQVRWQERNGPEVQPPRRKGFGTTMLERVLAGELGGNVRLLYEPHGLTCEIDAPWPLVEA